ADTGFVRWRVKTKGLVRGRPLIKAIGDDSRVYVATENGFLQCLNVDSGSLLWTRRYGAGLWHQFLVADERSVFVMDGKWHFIAFDLDSGEISWLSRLRSPGCWQPVWCDDYLVVLSKQGEIAVFEPAREIKLWEGQLPGTYNQPPAIGIDSNGRKLLVAASTTSGLLAFDIDPGCQRMTTSSEQHLNTTMSAEESNRKNWYVVSQVKSHRVVYFTDDPDYTPPMDGDWYYISSFQGELPADLTLRNCWSWRFNGTEFEDARTKKPTSQAETLLKSNKEALRHLLKEKIDLVRKHPVPNCVNSGILRELRLQEARVILGDAGVDETVEFPLLMNSAAVRGISVRAMAQRTIEAHERDTRVLIESELLRDEIAESINQAKNQSQLFSIRQRLLSEVVPSQSEKLKSAPTNTTPLHFALRPSEAILAQEQLRL
ncbi:hypothetical protein Q9L58_010823, partial [Maublancomyces gigas]